jgi:hypothetical protein
LKRDEQKQRKVMVRNYSRVCLLTDRYQSQGLAKGDCGYIIEIYLDARYEVEFSDASGNTFAQIVARREDLQLAEPVLAESAQT